MHMNSRRSSPRAAQSRFCYSSARAAAPRRATMLAGRTSVAVPTRWAAKATVSTCGTSSASTRRCTFSRGVRAERPGDVARALRRAGAGGARRVVCALTRLRPDDSWTRDASIAWHPRTCRPALSPEWPSMTISTRCSCCCAASLICSGDRSISTAPDYDGPPASALTLRGVLRSSLMYRFAVTMPKTM